MVNVILINIIKVKTKLATIVLISALLAQITLHAIVVLMDIDLINHYALSA